MLRSVIFYCDVGWCVNDIAVLCSAPQSSAVARVTKWLGLGVTFRVRVRDRARECNYFFLFQPGYGIISSIICIYFSVC